MPRGKKLPGQAADARNGQQVELAGTPLAKFLLPRRSDGEAYDLRTRRMWSALWADDRLPMVLLPADREVLVRWAQAVDDAIKARERAWADPVTKGSMQQDVPSPFFAVAAQALGVAERCEAQLGIGALNRARLGIAILAERASLLDLASRFPGGGGDEPPDPRLAL